MDKNYIILADANCDLNAELREKYDIKYLSCHFTCPDGTEEETFLEWKNCKYVPDCTSEKFYAALKKNPDGFATAPANAQEGYKFFEEYVSQGYGILVITISAGLSGSYNFMTLAKKNILDKYPEADICIVDSRRFACSIGLLAIKASELRSEGKSLHEVAEYLDTQKIRYHQAGWLDDLSFVAKKGRISNAKAFFGQLVGIKPIGDFDANGLTTVIGKVKGEALAYKTLLNYMEMLGEDLGNQIIMVAHTNRYPQAQTFKKMIEERFHPREVILHDVFPTSGINIGPGLMAAYFCGTPISEGLVKEKEVFAKALEASK